MGKIIFQIAFALCLITGQSHAQESNLKTKPASKEDMVGTWQVVAFMPGSFGEENADSDLLAPSQVFGFYEDEHVRSLVSDEKKDLSYTLDDLESRFGSRPQKIHYHFIEPGLLAITIDEKRELGTLWQTHIVTDTHQMGGLETRKGDLIMGMTPTKDSPNDAFRYIRIMQKVQ